MRSNEMEKILGDIKFRDWEIQITTKGNGTIYLQVVFWTDDNWESTGKMTEQRGRKWLLSEHMTKTEIVNTAWFAVKTVIEHEAREEFKYKGVDIYNSNIDVDSLLRIAHEEDVREPSPT